MKKPIVAALALAIAAAAPAAAEGQVEAKPEGPQVLVSPNLLGPLYGYYSAVVEFKLESDLALEVGPSYFNIKAIPLLGTALASSDLQFWYAGCSVGVNYYTKPGFRGGFAGGYAKGGVFTLGTADEAAFRAGFAGAGAKVGYRWTGSWASFAIGARLEYTYAFASVPGMSGTDAFLTKAVSGVSGMPFMLFSFVL